MAGVARRDQLAHQAFRRLVGDGDGIEVRAALVLDLLRRAEVAHDQRAGRVGQRFRESPQLGQLRAGDVAGLSVYAALLSGPRA